MAKFRVVIPYVVREMCAEVAGALNRHMGCPMEATVPDMGDDHVGKAGKARVHFPGQSFELDVVTGVDPNFGRFVRVERIEASMKFWSRQTAEEWIGELERFAGPLGWRLASSPNGEVKMKFELEGLALDRLQMNASNRRNGAPTYEWDDPNHPFVRGS